MTVFNYDELDDDVLLHEVMQDGDRLRVSLMMSDAASVTTDRTAPTSGYVIDNRPGGPYITDTRQAPPQTRDAAMWDGANKAYAGYVENLGDAWKRPNIPAGAYPLSSGEGSACTVNGAPGKLIRDGDWLVCRPTQRDGQPTKDGKHVHTIVQTDPLGRQQSTYSYEYAPDPDDEDDSKNSRDGATTTSDADRAYDGYVAGLQDAWKKRSPGLGG